jgi:3-hydroxyacyl-CoA dehydrogenase/enoyl-CoA hydratase/3-hydroxybutyryl-CoA epimerase
MGSEEGPIRRELSDDRIVTLVFDDQGQSANTFNAAFITALGETIDWLEGERENLVGIVLTSAKKTFFAGGDLNDLIAIGPDEADAAKAMVDAVKGPLRRLETLGVPVVAAIGGAALGGGLEIALAAHHRIVLDSPRLRLGFPEVTLGLLPGGGGVVRSVRLLGLAPALTGLLLEGRQVRPAQALEMGLIDEVVESPEAMAAAAASWIAANPEASQPWDRPDYSMPGGDPSDPTLAANLAPFAANLSKQLRGADYPAPKAILAAAVEGAQVDVENAFEIEGRYFVKLVTGQVAKNMIATFFFGMQEVNGDRGRAGTANVPPIEKLAVLGAGMMGAGIAYVGARAGLEVVLADVDAEHAAKGKAYSERQLAGQVERGRLDQVEADAILARIHPTGEFADAAGAEAVIEAVFEDPGVKAEVMAAIEPYLADGELIASNTSTLPITELAANVSRPQDFIGLHFFSPVDRMPLLEIIRGAEGSEETLDRALALARLLGKTPIVVNDSRGFFTSRVISTFINEGIAMLLDGVPAPSIEQASAQAGYPAPVLQLADELNLALLRRIRDASRVGAEGAGGTWDPHPAERVIDQMVEKLHREGRAAGAGFYEYEDGRRVGIWSGLASEFPPVEAPPPLVDLEQRLLFIEALEAVKCLDEGVIESVADANVGSVIGIGYPRWTGGVLQYIDGFSGGPVGFVARARELAERYGPRFEPPASLVEKAARGEPF